MSGKRGFLQRLKQFRSEFPWSLYLLLGANNANINRHVRPLRMDELDGLDRVELGSLDISDEEYRTLVGLPEMARFQQYDFVYDKALEYVISMKVLDIRDGSVHLDAASGYGEYARAALRLVSPETLYCLDAVPHATGQGRQVMLHGDVSAIPLPDESVDTLSCHHSFEHFKSDADTAFIREVGRVLRPGGRACILPLFLSQDYFELWNTRRSELYDPLARSLYDPLGTFPGWGPSERFARVYDVEAFRRRVLEPARNLNVRILEIRHRGKPAPDMRRNRHQPRVNGLLKALVLEKPAHSAG